MTIRWGIVGCGDVCEVKSGPAFYKAEGSELSFVMRRDAGRAADFARRHGVARFTTDPQALIDDPGVDAVYVATPPGTHLKYALAVARAGKPCYVEKPMARNAAECQRMLEAFDAARVPLFVAYYRRALPRFTRAKEIIASGRLGQVLTVSHVYQGRASGQPFDPWRFAGSGARAAAGWRESVSESGGGLFIDLGSHVVDLIDFLFGPITHIVGSAAQRASGVAPSPGSPEDTVVASFTTAQGVLGTLRHQFHTAGSTDRLDIVGTLGTLRLSVFGREPLELELADAIESMAVEHIAVEQPEHVHLPLVQSIVDELSGRGRCVSTGASGLRASACLDRVLAHYYGGRADEFWLRPETWPGTRP
jgi:1,5-anhydro-D-fructose reductase (1,5-anhydro-D-mannitol-forming)